ncbi:MAG TPA: tetratricopeptide repeat protein, partial [Longimicrobiales bacterium]|nr:tetratricopeptide repeat protein [Longimicrobiales bacterium]
GRGARRLLTWRNATIGGLAAALAWAAVATAWLVLGGPPRSRAAAGPGSEGEAVASIAALPFANLSADEDDRYFTDGIHEEILSQLAGISALHVISRTSVMAYRDTEKRLSEVADELGVRYILEGSVRRFQDRVRVTAQLIDAETDGHVWADSYERDRGDLFALQAEVAREIAGSLRAELTPEEQRRIERRPTADQEAYDLFLRARAIGSGASTPETLAAAERLYELALERDPQFLEALAELTHVGLLARWSGYDRSPERVEWAEALVERAERLDPHAGPTHYARGFLHYYGYRDFDAALREFEAAVEAGVPGARPAMAYILRRLGRWDEHLSVLRAELAHDPLNADLARNLAESLAQMGRYEEAVEMAQRALELAPSSGRIYWDAAEALLLAGAPERARTLLENAPRRTGGPSALTYAWYAVSRTARAYDDGILHIDASGLEWIDLQGVVVPTATLSARLYRLAGNGSEAEEALARAESLLAERLRDAREDPAVHAGAMLVAGTAGDAEGVRSAWARVGALYPVERDALLGARFRLQAARAFAWAGADGEAVTLLEVIMAAEAAPVSPAWLRLDPDWDGLRELPRFRELAREAT